MKKFKVYYRKTQILHRDFEANNMIECSEIAYDDIRKDIDKWKKIPGMRNLELSNIEEVKENTNQ